MTTAAMNHSGVRNAADLYKWIGIPLTVLLILFSILLMNVISDVRVKELRILLQNIDEGSGGGRSVGLIARYKIIRNRFNSGKENAADYLQEGELMAVLSGDFDTRNLSIDRMPWLEKPAVAVVNLVGLLVGAKPVRNLKEDRGNKILETAYFYERRREFKRAIQVYQVAAEFFKANREVLDYIRLHRGFCHSLSEQTEKALADYDAVRKNQGVSEMGLTAEILASFLRDVQGKLGSVDAMAENVDKGVAYYRLMAYAKSIETLNHLDKKGNNQKLYFYRGRSYEEIGKSKEAIRDYRKVIEIDPATEYARNANRRLYLLGAFYNADRKLAAESKKNAVKLKDTEFIRKSEKISTSVDAKAVATLEEDKTTKETLEFIREESEDLEKKGVSEKLIPEKTEPVKTVTNKEEKKPVVIRTEKKPVKTVTEKKPKTETVTANTVKEKKPKTETVTDTKPTKTKLTDPSLSMDQRKEMLIKKYKKVDKIYTQDGNVFVGAVLAEKDGKITIVTVFGVVNVPQDKVSMRLKVNSKGSL